jgi:hypothetical protein
MPAWTDINQLNGIVLTDRNFLAGIGGYASADDPNLTVINTYYTLGGQFSNKVRITVLDDTYAAGYTNEAGTYVPPTFGTLRVTRFQNSNPNAVAGNTNVLVRGFSQYQLLLSDVDDPQDGRADSTDIRYGSAASLIDSRGFPDQLENVPVTFFYDPTVFDTSAICFAEGTRLSTPRGPVAVEDLVAGDMVLTAAGVARPVRWVGYMIARPARHLHPAEINPVRVTAHAFAPGVPAADVRLSPGHAVHVDGVLVPIHRLVNDATIVQEEVERIRYFHVELETHDVLLAEGLPCESYLDDGNRGAFVDPGEPIELRGRLDPRNWEKACAAMVAAGPQLTAVQERLHARAEELGWRRTEEPALHLLVNGAELAPVHVAGQRYWFAAPAGAVVTLRSRAGVLAHVMPGLADARRLGVAVAEVRVDGVALPLDAAAFGEGFHAVERNGGQLWRWTDGAAVLAIEAGAPVMIELDVVMTAPTWLRPAAALRVVA